MKIMQQTAQSGASLTDVSFIQPPT